MREMINICVKIFGCKEIVVCVVVGKFSFSGRFNEEYVSNCNCEFIDVSWWSDVYFFNDIRIVWSRLFKYFYC